MEEQDPIKVKKPYYKKVITFIFWSCFCIILLVCSAVGIVILYEDEVKAEVIKELNKHLKTEVRISPKDIDITFISSFPKCAIEFKNLTAMEAWDVKEKDTLLFAENLSLRFSLKDLFDKKYDIKQITLTGARCVLLVDKNGRPNYKVWNSAEKNPSPATDNLKFKLENITLKNVAIVYKNKEQRIKTSIVINDLLFKGNFSQSNYELESEGLVYVNSIESDKVTYLKNKKLKMDVQLEVADNNYVLKGAHLSLNKMRFELKGGFTYSDSLESVKMNYSAENLDIESILSLLPDKHKENIKDYGSSGEFFASGDLDYTKKFFSIHSKFGINKATIEYKPKSTKLTNVMIKGELGIDRSKSFLSLDTLSANLYTDEVRGNFRIDNFNDPLINVSTRGILNLQNLYSFWPLDTIEKLEGNLKFNCAVKGLLSNLKHNTFSDKVSLDADLNLEKLKTKFKGDANETEIESCKIMAHNRDIKVQDFKLLRGKSEIILNGEIPGMFNYILDSKSVLVIKGKLFSSNIMMEDFIFSDQKTSSSTEEFKIPANLNLVLDAVIKNFSFGKFTAENINGNFELKNQKAMISDMRFETMEGVAEINALADASGKVLEVTLQTELKNINVKKMFASLNNFGQATLLDKNISGYATASIDFLGNWNKKLEPMLSTVVSSAKFNIEKGELIDFKPLESLARFVDIQELKRIKFASLNSKIDIRNSTIYIPQTTIKNSVLNIDFNGTHTFNNDVDYHIRLLISDLLAKKRKDNNDFGPVENDPDNRRSAFILMSGNIDNPVIKYDRKGLKQKINEDIKNEKQNIKQILKEEFGIFKKDSAKSKSSNKADQHFELEKHDNKIPQKTLELKKQKEDDDDF